MDGQLGVSVPGDGLGGGDRLRDRSNPFFPDVVSPPPRPLTFGSVLKALDEGSR